MSACKDLELENEEQENSHVLLNAIEYNQIILKSLGVSVIITNEHGLIKGGNDKAAEIFEEVKEQGKYNIMDILPSSVFRDFDFSTDTNSWDNGEFEMSLNRQKTIYLGGNIAKIIFNNGQTEYLFSLKDITLIKEREFEMLELQKHISENAYRDGVAENAVSVLHNIGNVLTTIISNVSRTESLEQMLIFNNILNKITQKLQDKTNENEIIQFITEDPQGKQLIPLLKELSSGYESAVLEFKDIFQKVENKCLHIGNIIHLQQEYANYKQKRVERVNLRELISNCLLMQKDRLEKMEIECTFDLPPTFNYEIEKIGLAQTLNNVILNSIEAIQMRIDDDPFYNDKTLTIIGHEEEDHFKICFQDNGIGIEPDKLKKLFNFGFSTKNRGSGFGLHNCANFLQANNSNMQIHSQGVNKGATIELCFFKTPSKEEGC